MMIEKATVISYNNGIATVQCYAKNGCGGCATQATCGTKSLSALAGEKTAPRIHLTVHEPLKVGEQIKLGLPEKTLLQGVMWLYCFPLMALIASTLGLSALISNELLVAAGALGVTGASFALIKYYFTHLQKQSYEPIYLGRA